MDVTLSSWLVILLALAGANLPFYSQKIFGLIALKPGVDGLAHKPLWLRLLELVVCYFVVGAIAFALEARLGNAFPQNWEFYAITALLLIVLSFPGFVLRYLRKHRH